MIKNAINECRCQQPEYWSRTDCNYNRGLNFDLVESNRNIRDGDTKLYKSLLDPKTILVIFFILSIIRSCINENIPGVNIELMSDALSYPPLTQ